MDRRTFGLGLAMVPASTAGASAQTSTLEANKRTVIDFYEKALNQKDFDAAAVHFGPHYIQHNPVAPDGIAGFKAFIAFRKERMPQAQSRIVRAFAEGDFVILLVHAKRDPNDRGSAIVDIFRLEAGKIVEHWDVIQPIPETMAHGNGMF